jgi:hypothetical protein
MLSCSTHLQFFFEQRSTNIGRIVQLAGAIIVEDMNEASGMSIEEVLVGLAVVVGDGGRELGQSGGGDLLEHVLVGDMFDASDIERNTVLSVRHLCRELFWQSNKQTETVKKMADE